MLKEQSPVQADKEYLKILYLAARETETGVDNALKMLIDLERTISPEEVTRIVREDQQPEAIKDPVIAEVDLQIYDGLFEVMAVSL